MSEYDAHFDQLLKKTYDRYVPVDFRDDGNLNPKREVDWDKPVLEQVQRRLQEITNDIVRRQIEKREPEPPLRGPMGGEAVPKGIPLPLLAAIKASGGSYPIMPVPPMIAEFVAVMPGPWVNELMLPPQIGCDEVLSALGLSDDEIDDIQDENRENNKHSSGGKSDPDDAEEGDDDEGGEPDEGEEESEGGEEDEEEEIEEGDEGDGDDSEEDEIEKQFEDTDYDATYAACAEIELGWLKILLIICKIIAIFKKIIDFVLSIIMPIIFIVQLAIGAWLNPSNIAKIIQFIIQMIIAIIVMIISMIIQLIWDLLNLDCIADTTEKVIEEIRKVLIAFASVANQFNPKSVALLMDKVDQKVLDPLKAAAAQFKENADGWRKMKDEVAGLFNDPEKRRAMMDEVEKQMKDGVAQGVMSDPSNQSKISKIGKVQSTFKNTFVGEGSAMSGAIDAVKSLEDWKTATAVKAKAKSQANKATSSAEMTVAGARSIVGLVVTEKESK